MSVEDKIAIHEVIAQYSYTWDAQDADEFARLFAEDAVWELVSAGETQPQVRLESRAAIRTWTLQNFQGRLAGVTTRHHQTGIVFDALSADAARTRTMVVVTHQGAADAVPRLSHTGVYDDQWRKTQAGWQFAHRTFRPDYG
jgi:uncharacterized protein (TIGR02246 family)